jgi:tetratricopeptide (TPR) repeat protein
VSRLKAAPVAGGTPSDDDPESIRRCRRALSLMHTHRGDAMDEIAAIIAAHPECIPAHCLRAGQIVASGSGDPGSRTALAASVAAIAAHPAAGDRRQHHAEAANAWLRGDSALALDRYGAIVVDDPRDILALVVAHALDFRLGRVRMLRDRVAQVLPEWNAGMPGYASVLAMYAFGLEENGQYRRAAAVARRALGLDPGHPAAIHALAHVMEMKGQSREGLAFLAATTPWWAEGTGYSVHLAWHQALFHLDADARAALQIYDAKIAPATASSPALADASALLWRLALRNVELGSRWSSLSDRWQAKSLDGERSFYAVHALMAFAAAGRDRAAARVIDALRIAGAKAVSTSAADLLAPPLGEALLAFAQRNYLACIEWISRVRHLAHRCGGSVAQCDLIHLTLTEAALRAHRGSLARALAAERAAQKPASLLNRLLLQRAGLAMPA